MEDGKGNIIPLYCGCRSKIGKGKHYRQETKLEGIKHKILNGIRI